jgi:hypothetical protein
MLLGAPLQLGSIISLTGTRLILVIINISQKREAETSLEHNQLSLKKRKKKLYRLEN